jgi:NifU-like domain
VADEKDFQKQVQRIGERVRELEAIADPAVRASAKELVQLLMEMHGTALERILEIVFQSSDGGTRVIDELGQDPLVSSLLVLYGLHPEDLQTRVERKLAEIRSRLYKMGAEATLLAVNGSDVRVRVSIEGHACGSTAQNVRATVEEAMYEAAPDLTSLVVEGLEEPATSGFVAMDALLGTASAAGRPVATLGRDGMD